MKKIIVKRIMYHSPASGETFYGATEYDGHLTAETFLALSMKSAKPNG